jgi:AraC-like DNA-binding protein
MTWSCGIIGLVGTTTVDVARALPHLALRPVVRQYVGYRLGGFAPGLHRGLPSSNLTFLISMERPIDTVAVPDGSPPPPLQALVAGLQCGPTVVRQDGAEAGVAVELTPLGARSLLGLPAVELTAGIVDLVDLLGAAGRALPDRLASAADWRSRFRLLDATLLSVARPDAAPPGEVVHAWRRIVSAPQRAVVAELAAEVGWSRRHLTEVFHREVGLPPRQFLRVLRFERSTVALARRPSTPLVELAHRLGYYDQAHLYREWRQLAGCSPVAWREQEELPSVHDTEGGDDPA